MTQSWQVLVEQKKPRRINTRRARLVKRLESSRIRFRNNLTALHTEDMIALPYSALSPSIWETEFIRRISFWITDMIIKYLSITFYAWLLGLLHPLVRSEAQGIKMKSPIITRLG